MTDSADVARPMDAAQTAQPLPLSGQRTLTPKEKVARSQALACNLPEKNKPSCIGQVYLGMFFDGTGNNRDKDLSENKQSNVVRLWKVHLDNSKSIAVAPPVFWRKEYVPGVGTPFPLIGETDYTTFGNAMSLGSQSRIVWGLIQTMNTLHRYVKGGLPLPGYNDNDAGKLARVLGDGPTSLALGQLKPAISQLKGILKGTKPTITQFNISVFGFSRGAAQARTFCTWFYQLCEKSGDSYTFAGVPVRIYFLGIFDTVASVGLSNLDIFTDELASGHAAWAKGTLAIHPAIERCVHFVASHEVRACFPLDLVRYMGTYPANCKEVVYPGVHSDIGGGYRPITQGRSALPSDGKSYSFSALMPCIDMHKEAIATGVPLHTINQMVPEDAKDFTATPQTVQDYNAYLKADACSGTVESQFKQRMHRYRFYRYKRLATFPDDAAKQGSPSLDTKFLRMTNDDFKEKCHEFKMKYIRITKEVDNESMRNYIHPDPANTDTRTAAQKKEDLKKSSFDPDELEMWEGMHRVGHLAEEQLAFFDNYLHDSIAGFAQDGVHEYAYNGHGHFRNRTIYDKGGN